MAKATKSPKLPVRKPESRTQSLTNDAALKTVRPGGKLGLILDKLKSKRGATADELVEATGWQRHSVLGALSKLKSRGFDFDLDTNTSRKAYRLSNWKG